MYEIIDLAFKQTARGWFDAQPVKPRRVINGSYWDFGSGQPIGTIIIGGKFVEGPLGPTNAGNGDAFGVKSDGSPAFARAFNDDFYFRDCLTSYPGPAPIWEGKSRPIEAKPVDAADALRTRSCIWLDKSGAVQMGVFHGLSLAGLRDKLYKEGATYKVALDGGGSSFCAEGGRIIYDSGENRKLPNIIVDWGEGDTGKAPLDIRQHLIPTTAKNYTGKEQHVSYVTIHNTGNYAASAGAKNHAEYLAGGADGTASWHYSVDKSEIYQSLPDSVQGRHSGGLGNIQGVGIEICVNDKAGFPTACRLAARLTASLLKKYGLGVDAVKQHYDWSGKDCPYELRHGGMGVTWAQFMAWVSAESAPAEYTPPVIRPTLRKGSKGEDVKGLQKLLLAAGQKLPKYGADGDFGAETEAAVKAYQAARGLVVDGICGPKTWGSLEG